MMEKVLTPGGFRPASFAQHVSKGHGLRVENGLVRKVDLATRRVSDFPTRPALRVPFGAHGPAHRTMDRSQDLSHSAALRKGELPTALADGWQAYTWWDSGTAEPITHFATTWTVPRNPATKSGQTVFLFNGIENSGSNFGILQPVLQWGPSAAGGGDHWSIANWYVSAGGDAYYSSLVDVAPGTVLTGVMTETAVSASGKRSYRSTFHNLSDIDLAVEDIEPLHWANVTLECYHLKHSSDLPAQSHSAFTGIDLRTGRTTPGLAWSVVDQFTDCGQHAAVVNNANPSGEVDLFYHPELNGPFDAMATLPNGKTYATFGARYVRYSDAGANTVDEGYPKPILGNWGLLPPAFATGFDSMATLPDGKTYITRGNQYVRYSDGGANVVDPTYPRRIAGNWGKIPAAFESGFDSMATLPNGKTYITRGGQYLRYSDASANKVDPGYPKPIAGNWGNIPAAFASGFDSMVTLPNGKTYVTRGDQYIRYSDPGANIVDAGYPKSIAGNW